jgi:hypothetical protein
MGRVGGDLAQAQDCSSLFFYFYTFPFISILGLKFKFIFVEFIFRLNVYNNMSRIYFIYIFILSNLYSIFLLFSQILQFLLDFKFHFGL